MHSLGRCNLPAVLTCPQLAVFHPLLDDRLELDAQIGDVCALFVDNGWLGVDFGGAVPADAVCRGMWW